MTNSQSTTPKNREVVRRRVTAAGVVAMLVASVACLAIAPALMPDSYSIVEHSISESAAQGVDGVWLARIGLLLFGFAVLVTAGLAGKRWGVWGRVAHRIFGVSIISTAAFGHMPWEDIPYDEFEDLLHSVASFAVGMSFIAGVLTVTLRQDRGAWQIRMFDWVAIAISPVISMVMFSATGIAGLVQRIMFAVAYVWYAMETVRSARVPEPDVATLSTARFDSHALAGVGRSWAPRRNRRH